MLSFVFQKENRRENNLSLPKLKCFGLHVSNAINHLRSIFRIFEISSLLRCVVPFGLLKHMQMCEKPFQELKKKTTKKIFWNRIFHHVDAATLFTVNTAKRQKDCCFRGAEFKCFQYYVSLLRNCLGNGCVVCLRRFLIIYTMC